MILSNSFIRATGYVPPPDIKMVHPLGSPIGCSFHFPKFLIAAERQKARSMTFFNSAVDVLQTLVIALGAGLGIWGGVNLLEGYGSDNPGANAHVR